MKERIVKDYVDKIWNEIEKVPPVLSFSLLFLLQHFHMAVDCYVVVTRLNPFLEVACGGNAAHLLPEQQLQAPAAATAGTVRIVHFFSAAWLCS